MIIVASPHAIGVVFATLIGEGTSNEGAGGGTGNCER